MATSEYQPRVVRRLAFVVIPVLAITGLTLGCAVRNLRVESLAPDAESVSAPVKAHLTDGRTVVFEEGVRFEGATVLGNGWAYGLTLSDRRAVDRIPLDSIAAMEVFGGGTDAVASAGLTVLMAAGLTFGLAALAVAIFGSCPTVYAEVPDLEPQAELFSYSIAPQFEGLDVDRLSIAPGKDGVLRIVVKNEALETHYIDHLEVLEVEHRAGESVVVAPDRSPLVLGVVVAPSAARDRAGRDLRDVLSRADDRAADSDPGVLHAATGSDPNDAIEVEFPLDDLARRGQMPDSVALALRVRNSLLSTVLFYDIMLGDQGVHALEWLASDLDDMGKAMDLYLWTQRYLGLRVEVWDGSRYRLVRHLPDTGPIAWEELGLVVPVLTSGSLRLRLSFLADSWRIDRVAVARDWHRSRPVVRSLGAVVELDGRRNAEATSRLRDPDDRYLVTYPGQYFKAEFPEQGRAEGSEAADRAERADQGARTYLLKASGYYTEWIRRSWLTRDPTPFTASSDATERTLRRWESARDSLELEFFRRRVPVP